MSGKSRKQQSFLKEWSIAVAHFSSILFQRSFKVHANLAKNYSDLSSSSNSNKSALVAIIIKISLLYFIMKL